MRHQTATYWLPLAVKYLPESYVTMKSALQTLDVDVDKSRVLHAQVLLLQQARMNQIIEQDWMVGMGY